jgi:hypothetical protein
VKVTRQQTNSIHSIEILGVDRRRLSDYCALQQLLHCTTSGERQMSTNDTINNINEMTNKTVERMTSLGELNVRIFEKMAARQMDALSLYMEHSMRVMKLATESKGYNEFLKGQADATKELSERILAESKNSMQAVTEVRDDYRAWFEKNLAEVNAELRKAVPAV